MNILKIVFSITFQHRFEAVYEVLTIWWDSTEDDQQRLKFGILSPEGLEGGRDVNPGEEEGKSKLSCYIGSDDLEKRKYICSVLLKEHN